MKNFSGNIENIDDVKNFLPDIYKDYANNLELLKKSMCSLYEIVHTYKISDIEKAPLCYGCLYDCMGQKDHMDCITGCLHDPNMCYLCP